MKPSLYRAIIFAAIVLFTLLPGIALADTHTGGSAALGIAGSLLGGSLDIVGSVLAPLGYAVMKLASYITMLGGMALNAAVYFTVIEMATNFGKIGAIDSTWAVIRDLANMGFIFVLLWASLKLIMGNDEGKTQRLIVNMIIAAILINFSLFFTKVVIDIANLLALTFYSAIADVSQAATLTSSGISNSIMDALKINSIYDSSSTLLSSNVFVVTVLSSVVLLITAFVFFAAAIMLVIRYVVLIFVLILSPIAFVSKVLPGLDTVAKQWKDTLIGQGFFAPIFFLLMWVSIKVAQGMKNLEFLQGSTFGNAFSGAQSVPIIINFAVVITFIIVSLVTAKKYADMAPSAVGKATKWAMGVAGGASFGLAGFAGRRSIGAVGGAVGESEFLKKRAAKSGFVGAASRLTLAAGRKTSKASFDVRGTALGGPLEAGKAQEGGYEKDMKNIADRQKKYGESLKPSDIVVDKAQQELDNAKKADTTSKKFTDELNAEKDRRQATVDDIEHEYASARSFGASDDRLDEIENRLEEAKERLKATESSENYKQEKVKAAQDRVDELKGVSEDEARKRIGKDKGIEGEALKKYLKTKEGETELKSRQRKSEGDIRKGQYADTLTDPRWIKTRLNPYIVSRGDKQAAADLRKGKKPVKDQLESILKEAGELKEKEEDLKEAVEDLTEKTEEKGGGTSGAGGAPTT